MARGLGLKAPALSAAVLLEAGANRAPSERSHPSGQYDPDFLRPVAPRAYKSTGFKDFPNSRANIATVTDIDRPHWVPKKAIQVHCDAVTLLAVRSPAGLFGVRRRARECGSGTPKIA
ncbi:hypothetical protein K438DRAFT_1777017 [Mycena galopus ATCC 62051]|nr:hypothetical protein K438DRAFT_1777017 [Mycena galopus ATCC 62051]